MDEYKGHSWIQEAVINKGSANLVERGMKGWMQGWMEGWMIGGSEGSEQLDRQFMKQ